MSDLPLYNPAHFLGGLPVRVSTQAVRDKDFYHFHQQIQLCFVLSGELKHRINDREYIQNAGTCAFVLPYMSHTLDSSKSDDTPIIVYVWFDESFLTERGYDFCSFGRDTAHFEGFSVPAMCEFDGHKSEAISIIRNIMNEFNMQENMSHDAIAAYIAELMRLACIQPVKKRTKKLFVRQLDRINRATDYVIKNYSEKINTDDLCKVANMSRRSFTTHFKSLTGLTVAEFILSVRLFYASQLLFYKDLLFDDIAEQCGLFNHSNLARVFSKYLGTTPTQFKIQHEINTSILHQIPIRERYKWLFEKD